MSDMRNIINKLNEGKGKTAFPDPDQTEDFGNEFKSPKALLKYILDNFTIDQIVKEINNYTLPYIYFPSTWGSACDDIWGINNVPYPGFLASALVKSTAAESVTDLANIYYSDRDLSPKAVEVFTNHALNGDKTLSNYGLAVEELATDPQLGSLAKHKPNLFKQIVQAQLDNNDATKLLKLLKTKG